MKEIVWQQSEVRSGSALALRAHFFIFHCKVKRKEGKDL